MTLATVLSNIKKSEWNSFVWRIQAHQFAQQHEYQNAIESIEEAIKLDSSLLDAWHTLARLHKAIEVSDEKLASVLNRIPNKVLAKNSKMATDLIIEIARAGDFFRAEKIILDWFVENPIASAIAVTNFYFNFILHNKTQLILTLENIGNCIVGVTFKKDNTQLTKLLVDNTSINHDCLLDVNSSLGQMLNEMEVCETRQWVVDDITLIERLPPYIAAFRISSKLRQDQHNGSDGFYSFTVPDNPDEMFAVFERKLSMFNGDKQKKDETLNNPELPLMFKGNWLCSHNPVKAALELLLTKTVKHQLPDFGIENPSEIILDIYTIIYLALTGLVHGFIQSSIKLVITEETKFIIEQWLAEINREDYLSIGVRADGGLWRQTADDIRKSSQDIQNGLRLIIDNSEIIKPALIDMPPLIIRIQSVIDISVYSSMKLSISKDIPWLCIDTVLANIFIHSGWQQVNTFKLFTSLGHSLSFEQKKQGLYLYAQETLPYTLTYRDLGLLSITDDEHAHYFLAKILFLHPKAFPDTKTAVNVLIELLVPVLIKAYLKGDILKGLRVHNPRNNGYAERVFNACCHLSVQCDDGNTAERKLAMLLYRLLVRFVNAPLMQNLIAIMTSEFARGHFMDIPMINTEIEGIFQSQAPA